MESVLLGLSWTTLVTVASGYAAYLLSYAGKRRHHTQTDTIFLTLVFGLPSAAAMGIASDYIHEAYLLGAIGGCSALGGSIAWSVGLRDLVRRSLRRLNVTWTNDDISALDTVLASTGYAVSGLSVTLDDDSILECRDTREVSDAPFGPFVVGQDGSFAIYATFATTSDGIERPIEHLRSQEHGDRLTYIPSARVKTATFRFKLRR